MFSVILAPPLLECSNLRYVFIVIPKDTKSDVTQGSGVQAIDEEIKKYTTLSYRFSVHLSV